MLPFKLLALESLGLGEPRRTFLLTEIRFSAIIIYHLLQEYTAMDEQARLAWVREQLA